ncbi:GH3 family domain-containing protein [Belliella pelovolcani]|uniref:GH3 auxin-responsive promoter n=1 Tax=Belliella pelovolcani TaxID=529505 RepID=A0A1N7LD07_9BACT|nr:GH3 auxin-responsive promoter family protein [Belliella pelovolcani]SIS71643.1 GH3 auxin-responsive promoter [Belliella pelovolcani]
MALIGEIIKRSVETVDKIFTNNNPMEAQLKVLEELLNTAKNTAFGKYYQFDRILKAEDIRKAFESEVPYFDYDQLRASWWQKVIEGGEDITWPGKVDFFAVSSGTTSTKKHIPVTEDMLQSIRRAEIKITGRTKHFLNVVGAQLSVIQMNKAIKSLSDEFGFNVKEFTVAAISESDEYLHRWYLGVEGVVQEDEEQVADRLDEILQENNKNYKVARNKALKRVEVKLTSDKIFRKWTAETKQKGGQVKFPRVMKEKDFRAWEEYVTNLG